MTSDAWAITATVTGTQTVRQSDELPAIEPNGTSDVWPNAMCGDLYENHTCSADSGARYGQAVLGLASFLLIIFGNGLTILVILTDRKLHKVSFLVILNLAVGDFLLGIVSQPPSVYYAFTCFWPGGSEGFLCQFVGFFICLLCSVSILSLGFVSYERYLYVVHPFEYQTKMTFGRGIFTCAMLWLYCTLASLFPVSGLWDGVGLLPDAALCNVLWHVKPLYMWAMILLVLLPSAIVIMYSYYKLVRMARAMSRVESNYQRAIELNPMTRSKNGSTRSNQESPTPDSSGTPDSQSLDGITPATPISLRKMSIGNARKVAKVFVKERKSTITVTVLIGTFVVCWTPYVIIHIVQASRCEPLSFWGSAITQWLCIFNSACNPIVYGATNTVFRGAVKRFVRRFGFCRRMRKGAPSPTLARGGVRNREMALQGDSQEEIDTPA